VADESQLKILKQGVGAWNDWRRQAGDIAIDLSDLIEVDLEGVSLMGADLRGADLSGGDLVVGQRVVGGSLRNARLVRADLSGANLTMAHLDGTHLGGANLRGANLLGAHLTGTELEGTDFSGASFFETELLDLDLSRCKGLESITHHGPSSIDIRTLQRSGPLPLVFLRGVGLPDALIEYLPSLLNQSIQLYSCFISYSSKDEEFVRRLHADLQAKGVRCWFAPEDMKIGAKILDTLDQAIRLRDKILLVLSEASVASDWVEDEVTKGFAEERQRSTTVLFPVRIDDAVFATNEAWAVKLRDNRNIGDFRRWKNHDAYQKTLTRLLRDLRIDPA
jgi:hypothetical protein